MYVLILLSQEATSYDSPIWTAKEENQTNFNSQFWSANVTAVCLTSDLFSIQLPVQAPSLRSLFFQKKILNITFAQWMANRATHIPYLNEPGCYESGFNVGDSDWVQARIGIVGLGRWEFLFEHTGYLEGLVRWRLRQDASNKKY